MSDTFQCAKCGAQYTRERRRVGRAVICSCGHKFLVPPPDDEPPNAPRASGRLPATARGATMDDAGDSSSEAIPLAELVDEAPAPVRWAEPIEDDEPLPEAEIVYAAPAAPAYPAEDLFAAGGPYADPLNTLAGPTLGRRVPAARTVPTKKKPSGRRKGEGMHANVTDVIASIALFGLLPIGVLFFTLGLLQYFRLGRLMPEDVHGLPPPPAFNGGWQPSPRTLSRGQFFDGPDQPSGLSPPFTAFIPHAGRNEAFLRDRVGWPSQAVTLVGDGPGCPSSASTDCLIPARVQYIDEQSSGGRTRVANDVATIVAG